MKKKIYISILTTILCFPVFMWTPLANAVSQSYTTGYGSYYFTYNNDLDTFLVTFGNLGGIYMKGYCQTLTYEFNDTYSGYLDIHLLSESIFMNATVITENCYVKGKNSSQWDYSIGFKDATSIKVTIVLPTMSTNNSWSGNKMALTTNYNITRDVTTVEDYLEDIETTMGQIDAQLSTMATSLSNIYGVESASRQLLAEIEYAIRGNNSLYVLADDMGTLITDMNSIINTVSKIEYNQMYIPPHARMFMECITRQDITKIQHDVYGNYVVIDANPYRMYMTYNTPMIFIYETNVTDVIPSFYSEHCTVTTLGFVRSATVIYYAIKVESTSNGYKDFIWQYPNNKKIYPLYLGPQTTVPAEFQFIMGNYFNDAYINRLDLIKNAINNMSVNVNNMTVNATGITYNVNNTQVDNSVTSYNTNINQVYNIENNISADFNTYNEQFTPDFSSSLIALQDTSTMMNGIITQINGIQLFTVPILLTLAGIVLLAILG